MLDLTSSINECLKCSIDNCKNCNDSVSICKECFYPYFLEENLCQLSCSDHYMEDPNTTI